MLTVLPFSREQKRGKLGSQDSFLQAQVAECLKDSKNALSEYIRSLKASKKSHHCLGSQELKGGLRKMLIT